MTKKPLYDPEERVFTIADVKKLARAHKKKMIRAAWIGALLAVGFFLIATQPKYQTYATFKETENKSQQVDLHKLMGGLIGGGNVEHQTVAMMQSSRVMKPLVERLGIQARIPRKGILSKVYKRVRDNLLSERGCPLSDIDWFVFRDCRYNGEEELHYQIRFDDPNHFSILSGKEQIASGSLGDPIFLPQAQLKVVKTPQNLRLGMTYPLSIRSWINAVREAHSQLSVFGNKAYKSVFELKFSHRDRHYGVEFLNALMEEYQRYLKNDYDEIATNQLVYLEKKQEEVYGKLTHVFDEYTGYLQRNLSESGQIGLKAEIGENSTEYRILSEKLFALDMEEEYLLRAGVEQKVFPMAANASFSQSLNEILRTISDFKQQRDLIEISSSSKGRPFDELEYANRRDELKGIRNRIQSMKLFLSSVNDKEPLFDPDASLGAWANRLTSSPEEEREDLAEYIENTLHLLAMQEKVVQEQIFYGNEIPLEFKGIDLETSRALFIEYNHKLDESAGAAANFARLSEEIEEKHFEISSLSAVLPDLLSQRLIGEASNIAIKLKDEKHRSEKEKGRWQEELVLQKKILKDHLDQLAHVEQSKSSLFRDKIAALQSISLNCLTGKISVLQERLKDSIAERKKTLSSEREILKGKMKEIRGRYAHLPEKWRKEKWLNLKTLMGMKMINVLTELVESKTLSSHLHHIESKPLDIATLSSQPIHPGLLIKGFLGAFLGALASFGRVFFRTALAGFPSSEEKLRAMRFPLAGKISPSLDGPGIDAVGGDLEALRQISLLFDRPPQGKIIGLFAGQGPDYSHALAQHLARMSLKPLLIQCHFHQKFHPKEQPGLLQVWKQEADLAASIRSLGGYDYLPPGGYTSYGAEVVRSQPFQKLLEESKKQYSHILLVFRSSLDSVESRSPLSFLDKAIVTVSGEPTEQLTPFIDWAYHEGMCRLSFLTTDLP